MPTDPYAVLRALLRAEAVRNTPKPQVKEPIQQQSPGNGAAEGPLPRDS